MRPAVINLRVGDSIPSTIFYGQFTTLGLTRRGDTVKVFTKTLSISRGRWLELQPSAGARA